MSDFVIRREPGSEDSSRALSQALNSWLTTFGPSSIFRTCENCTFMDKGKAAFCRKYNMTPPVEVILRGCDAHDDECEIPF